MKKTYFIVTVVMLLFFCGSLSGAMEFGGRVATYIGTSSETKPTNLTGAGQTFMESDTGALYYYTGSAWTLWSIEVTCDPDTLDAAGYGTPICVRGFREFTVIVKAIGTAATADWTVLGKLGEMPWTNLNSDGMKQAVQDSINSGTISSFTELSSLDSLKVWVPTISDSDSLISQIKEANVFK